MSNNSLSENQKQIEELLLKAEQEKKVYNWENAIELMEKAKKICKNKELMKSRGEICYNLGEIHQIAADYGKKDEDILKEFQLSISSFQEALKIFEELKIEEKMNACSGLINLIKSIIESNLESEEILLLNAKKLFCKSKIINLEKGNPNESLKNAILENRALSSLIGGKLIKIDEKADLKEMVLEFDNLLASIWDDIKKQKEFSDIYLYYLIDSIMEFTHWTTHFLPSEYLNLEQFLYKMQEMFEEMIEKFKNSANTLSLFYAYTFYSWTFSAFSTYYAKNIFEQKKWLKKAQKWLGSGVKLLPSIGAHNPLVLFYYTRYTTAIFLIDLGFSAEDFKFITDDLTHCIASSTLLYPKTLGAHNLLYTAGVFLVGALNRSSPEIQRLELAKRILELLQLAQSKVSIVNDPNHKIYNLLFKVEMSTVNTILGDLLKDENERQKHLKIAADIFNEVKDYQNPNLFNTYFYYSGFLFCASRTAMLLAKNALKISEKLEYHKYVVEYLTQSKKMIVAIFHIENLFLIGDSYHEIGRLTEDAEIFKESYHSYTEAIKFCKDKGYFNLMGSGFIQIAQIDDRLGNFVSAAVNYKNAIDSFDKAIATLTHTELVQKIEKEKDYMTAWNLIETAKSYHIVEDHNNAQLKYEKASSILEKIPGYNYEAAFYSAWSILEKAESFSKENKHQESAEKYQAANRKFEEAIKIISLYLSDGKPPEVIDRLKKLIQVAQIREIYCNARYQIETARLESLRGNRILAAELYVRASSLFEKLCQTFRLQREKEELTAIFYLCRAWEQMERADFEQKSDLYKSASELFEKASNIFPENRMKKLSLGNSSYCSAIQYGTLFDRTKDFDDKTEYYKKIKMFLRDSAKNYELGGFTQESKWAIATSTFFDGIWHIIQSDNETDHYKKNHYLSIATNYLNSALDIFGNAGYIKRRQEILKYLKLIKNEQMILTSALNLIEKPLISESSVGISAPSCPLEISSSTNIREMQNIDKLAESEANWKDRILHIYFYMPQGVCIFDHSFRKDKEVSPGLVTGGLMGLSSLIQELTENQTKIKIIEQEEVTILFEYGKYITVALITEENLNILRNKLLNLLNEVEDFYSEELESFSGKISTFSKIIKFIPKYF